MFQSFKNSIIQYCLKSLITVIVLVNRVALLLECFCRSLKFSLQPASQKYLKLYILYTFIVQALQVYNLVKSLLVAQLWCYICLFVLLRLIYIICFSYLLIPGLSFSIKCSML